MDQSRHRFNQRRFVRPATWCRPVDFFDPVPSTSPDASVDVSEVVSLELPIIRFGLGLVVVPPPTSPGS